MRILYLPIDERFTTYSLFRKYAEAAGIDLVTISLEKLGHQKISANKQEIVKVIEHNLNNIGAVIISAEMLLYGGLVPSRVENETLESLLHNISLLEKIHSIIPSVPIYISTSVLRIPKTSSSSEEPDYYADYGKEIFEYSYYTHKYESLGNSADKVLADNLRSKIPDRYLSDFLGRRQRHHSINMKLIEMVRRGIISYLAIGLDDNAQYGFNVKEGIELTNASADLQGRVLVRNGTDELQFPLLSRIVSAGQQLKIMPVYFHPECKKYIPAFESSPLCETVEKQIIASGAVVTENIKDADILCLLINSCLGKMPQAMSIVNVIDKSVVDKLADWLDDYFVKASGKGIIIADCTYTNGSDKNVVEALFKVRPELSSFIYGAWNTVSNTIGSIIPLAIIKNITKCSNNIIQKLNIERFVEDWGFMVDARPEIIRYIGQSTDFDTYPITKQQLKPCYELATKIMQRNLWKINQCWGTNYNISNVHSLWERTFEISFDITDVKERL